MPAERYYFHGPLQKGKAIFLEKQEFHHLVHVMRSEKGDEIEMVDGKGTLASGEVINIHKKDRAEILIKSVEKGAPPLNSVILVQAIPRFNRLDNIVEKGTELGMTELWLFPAEYSERKDISESHLEKMKTIALTSMKQCGTLYLPMISLKSPLKLWKEVSGSAFFGDVAKDAPPLLIKKRSSPILFFIGPEKGFSKQEIVFFRNAGVQGVHLHDNILRTDTAGMTALALIQFCLASSCLKTSIIS